MLAAPDRYDWYRLFGRKTALESKSTSYVVLCLQEGRVACRFGANVGRPGDMGADMLCQVCPAVSLSVLDSVGMRL